jgi:hypothetical protein
LLTIFKMKDFEGSQVISTLSEVFTCKHDGGRDIYLEKKSAEAATAVHLPLVLARFLMGKPMMSLEAECSWMQCFPAR